MNQFKRHLVASSSNTMLHTLLFENLLAFTNGCVSRIAKSWLTMASAVVSFHDSFCISAEINSASLKEIDGAKCVSSILCNNILVREKVSCSNGIFPVATIAFFLNVA